MIFTPLTKYKKYGYQKVGCSRSPFTGLGKPEALKHDLSGYWSRRIDNEHRLIYQVTNEEIIIVACKYHYI